MNASCRPTSRVAGYRSIALIFMAGLMGVLQTLTGGPVHAQRGDSTPLNPPAPAGRRQFVFDGRFVSFDGLAFNFSRPVATVDPLAASVPANQPRYEREVAIAGAPVFEHVRTGSSSGLAILGSGVDHDGTTPLLVIQEFQ